VAKNEGKWKPGGRGRPPKNAAQLKPRPQVAPTPTPAPPAPPDPSAPPPAPSDELGGTIENPFRTAPPPAAGSMALPTPTPPPPLPPWQDDEKIAALEPFFRVGGAVVVGAACRKTGRSEPTPKQFDDSKIARTSTQLYLYYLPDLAIDPGLQLAGLLLVSIVGLVVSQPKIHVEPPAVADFTSPPPPPGPPPPGPPPVDAFPS
jgi:hypothetical protein